MPIGNAFPVRSTIPGLKTVGGVFTGGGAATSCTQAATDWNRGIVSVVYVSTGRYTVNFLDVGQQLVGYSIQVDGAAGVDPVVGQLITGSFDSTTKLCVLEFGATLIDLLTTNKLYLSFTFATNAP